MYIPNLPTYQLPTAGYEPSSLDIFRSASLGAMEEAKTLANEMQDDKRLPLALTD